MVPESEAQRGDYMEIERIALNLKMNLRTSEKRASGIIYISAASLQDLDSSFSGFDVLQGKI